MPSRFALHWSIALVLALAADSCAPIAPSRRASRLIPPPSIADDAPRDYPGIHNAVSFGEGFISGSVPDGDPGFDTLAAMGVKTIISVDGAVPDVDRARSRGIRYIHLPIGYNGFDDARRLDLVRATRDARLVGPVYIHCHHGKHRSAGAAATIAASLGWLTPQVGVERMKVSGTAAGYRGLYACAANATVLSRIEIDASHPEFPSISRPTDFVGGMIELDEVVDHLRAIEQAGWQAPTDHPDLVPAAEAGRLADLYRALEVSDEARRRPAEFVDALRRSNIQAQALEDMLASGTHDLGRLSAKFEAISASCKACHVKHRD